MKKSVNEKIKIILSVLGDISIDDGTTIRAKRIFDILKQRYDTIIITRSNNKFTRDDIFIVRPKDTKFWNLKLIPIIMKNKFNIVYCSSDWFGFFTFFILAKIYRFKIIFEAHGILSEENKEKGCMPTKVKLYKILESFVIRNADWVVTLSEDIYNFYIKYNKNIEQIPVFVDDKLFKKNDDEMYHEKDSKLIGIIGPFDNIINMQSLNFIYSNINYFDNKINFVIFGNCNDKIEDKRIFYTGYIEKIQDYVYALGNVDMILIISKIATSGPLNKIIEPMSCSIPVFTTPKGIVGLNYPKNAKDIFVFDEDKIIYKINKLIFDHQLMKNVGKNARIIVEKYYSRKINEKKLIEIIDRIGTK